MLRAADRARCSRSSALRLHMTQPNCLGIQGFGLLGRSLFRLALDRPEIEVGGVAETADPEMLRYLLRFSTLPWPVDGDVALDGDRLSVNGFSAPVVRAGAAGEAPWGDLGVTTVVDFRETRPTRDELAGHLDAGAERVVLCAPPGGELDRTVVVGLNDGQIGASDRIVSAGSFTAHCAGPLLRILDGGLRRRPGLHQFGPCLRGRFETGGRTGAGAAEGPGRRREHHSRSDGGRVGT